ncbi:MAG: hypothetical protein SFU25_00490 [Candidatus Caenarcaniphilales bacterium]|nr:hypothetical protein [Candidatus Caenarcaniphilales bacterium]
MNIKEEDKLIAQDILGYMLAYGQALNTKDSTKIKFIKGRIQSKIENLSIDSLTSVLKVVDQIGKQVKADKSDADRDLRLLGFNTIREIVDVEITDKGLELSQIRENNKKLSDLASTTLKELTKSKTTASLTEDPFKKHETLLRNLEKEVTDLVDSALESASILEIEIKKLEKELDLSDEDFDKVIVLIDKNNYIDELENARLLLRGILGKGLHDTASSKVLLDLYTELNNKINILIPKPPRVEYTVEKTTKFVEKQKEKTTQQAEEKSGELIESINESLEKMPKKSRAYVAGQKFSARLDVVKITLKTLGDYIKANRADREDRSLLERIVDNLAVAHQNAKNSSSKQEIYEKNIKGFINKAKDADKINAFNDKVKEAVDTPIMKVIKDALQNQSNRLTPKKASKAHHGFFKSEEKTKKAAGSKRKKAPKVDLVEATDKLQKEKTKKNKKSRRGIRGSFGTL